VNIPAGTVDDVPGEVFRMRGRLLIGLFAMLLGLASAAPASAKAHLIAVVPLRSNEAAKATASAVTAELARRLALIPGYDARVVVAREKRDVDAAAEAGAEVYVVGQVIDGDQGGRVAVISSYDVASDHRIDALRVVLDPTSGALPASVDVAALVGSSGAGAAASVLPGPTGTSYLLVPFAQPGNSDTALEFATTEFVKKMSAKGSSVVIGEQMEQVEAASSVAKLCKAHDVRGVFIGNVRHEQRLNVLLGSYPTHAEARVGLFSCDGTTLWKGYGIGDLVYYWSNAGAAVSDAVGKALDTVVAQFAEQYVKQPTPTPSP
jgi:hypothetical protein